MSKRKKKIFIPKIHFTKREKRINMLIRFICMIFIFISMFSLIEIDIMDNNLSGVIFFLLFFAIGIVASFYLSRFIDKRLPEFMKNSKKTYNLIGSCIFILSFLFPTIANYYNRTYPITKVDFETYRVIEKTKSKIRRSEFYTYYLYIELDNEKARLLTNEEIWNKVNEQGYVKLGIATGGLGFKYVCEIVPN